MPRYGPPNLVHKACYAGIEASFLTNKSWSKKLAEVDIDEGDPLGLTPLMISSQNGSSIGVRILLDNGASVSVASIDGHTALLLAAERGHLDVVDMLIDAEADLEAADCQGSSPLHRASFGKHANVVKALIEAGANVNSRDMNARTPLYVASMEGDVDVTRELLLANADAQLGRGILPIDMAAGCGHSQMVKELLGQLGIEGCGGRSGGVDALHAAAQHDHVDILAMLTEAGVVDTGTALIGAAERGHEAPVKFLLQEHATKTPRRGAYVKNTRDDPLGRNPLRRSVVEACRACAPRVVRMLVDAGVDTTSAVPITKTMGGYGPASDMTLLAFTTRNLRAKTAGGNPATEEELHKLEAIRRLLLRVRAVRAVSWLWFKDAPPIGDRVEEGARKAETTSAPLERMMPTLQRRSARRGVSLASLFRHSQKP